MITIPLAWVVSILTIIAGVALALNARLPIAARVFLASFLFSMALTAGLLGLRLGYGVVWAARVQPLVAVTVVPLAYLGFRALTQEAADWRSGRDAVILALAWGVIALVPGVTDIVVIAIMLVYLVRLGLLLSLAPDAFLHVPSASFGVLRAALIACLCLLGMLAITDLTITLSIFFGDETNFNRLLSGASGVFAAGVFVVALVGVPLVLRRPEAGTALQATPTKPSDDDTALLTRLEALMQQSKIYTDSALTLARVARRLSVPARDVSAAVNRGTAQNFSRYVNAHRVTHAQTLLEQGDLSVTDVMLESGFVSKSSFNSEFRRITGQTPSQYRASR